MAQQSNRRTKQQERKAAKRAADLKKLLASPCAYCGGSGRAPGDGETPCGFCEGDR